jgi:hypothetical protein
MVTRFTILVLIYCLAQHVGLAEPFPLPKVSFHSGKCYLQLKRDNTPKPSLLQNEQIISELPPYALVTAKDAFLEVKRNTEESQTLLRLGRSSALEFQLDGSYFFIKGSALFSSRYQNLWVIKSDSTEFKFLAEGTWLMETTPLGFKVILLEGTVLPETDEANPTKPILPGELALVSGQKGFVSQSLKVELPVLLSTSRLINIFPSPLPSQSRLISAAQVQSLRTKARYNAFIGGVSEDSKLRIWSPSTSKPSEE